ncbi:MAG TPA: hypothetical protein VKR06_00610 [Ktedonosporobacter sp.]|nr:hypothetical protein [Ktedonosporobacter sp.]
MAAFGNIHTLQGSSALELRSVWMQRLTLGGTTLLGAAIFMLGTCWDIQWHSFVGRDRTLIPPHIMMLSGITLAGLAALTSVLIETLWTRRNPLLTRHTTEFAGLFRSSLGSYLAGFAALDAAIAFPLDAYWHSLYGIDVAIWAPFHIMILVGGALIPLGAAYMLISVAQLAASRQDRTATRVAYIGAIMALATMLSISTYMLMDGLSNLGFINLGFAAFNLFPLLSGLVIALIFTAAVQAIPWRRVATSITLVYLFFAVLFTLFVPPATNALVIAEHLAYRRSLGAFANLSVVVMQGWNLTPLLAALLIDYCYRRAQNKGWSMRRLMITIALIAVLGALPVTPFRPVAILNLALYLGAIGFSITLLLGLLGTSLGTWLGSGLGASMRQSEGVR